MPPVLGLFQHCAIIWKTLYHFGTCVTSFQGQLHCVAVLTYNMVIVITCSVTCAMSYRSANLTTLTNKKWAYRRSDQLFHKQTFIEMQ